MSVEKEIIAFNMKYVKFTYIMLQVNPKLPIPTSSTAFIDEVKIVGLNSRTSVIIKAALMPCTERYVAEYGKVVSEDDLMIAGITLPHLRNSI